MSVLFRFARFGIAAALSVPLAAWAWNRPIEDPARSAVAFTQGSGNAAGRYWGISTSLQEIAVLHYADGTTSPAAFASHHGDVVAATLTNEQGELLTIQHDGTFVGRCRIVKYDTGATLRWETQTDEVPCGLGPPVGSRLFPAQNASVVASVPNRIVRLGTDGRILARLDTTTMIGTLDTVDPRNGSLYTIDAAEAAPQIAAYDTQGTRRWVKPLDGRGLSAVAPDGSLRVAGVRRSGGLFLAAYAANDGALLWSTAVEPTTSTNEYVNLRAPIVDANGATFLASGIGAAAAVKLDANGQVAWRANRADLGIPADANLINAALAPDGDLVVTHNDRATRLDAAGAKRYSKVVVHPTAPARVLSVVAFEADGTAVLQVYATGSQQAPFVRIAPDGTDRSAPQTLVSNGSASAERALLADGSIVSWSIGHSGARELVRIGADGGTLWRKATPGSWIPSVNAEAFGTIAAGDGRVCVLGAQPRSDNLVDQVLACHRIDDGGELWTRKLFERAQFWTNDANGRLRIDADGTLVAWYEIGTTDIGGNVTSSVGYTRFGRDGNVLATRALAPDTHILDTSPPDAPFALIRAGAEAVVFGADGGERYRFATSRTEPLVGAFGADGSLVAIYLFGGSPPTGSASRYDATGHKLWTQPFEASASGLKPPVIVGDSVYVASCCIGAGAARRVAKLSLEDGSVRWQRDLPPLTNATASPSALVATPDGDAVASVSASARTIDVDVLDTLDGTVRARHREACRTLGCTTARPLVSGTTLHGLDAALGGTSALFTWPIPAAQNAFVRIDQIGIAGPWWSPYANGEGIVIDFLPDSRTFFAPWFTFSRGGGNDPAGQRWYVVQGQVPANARSVELPITETTGGNFDAGPTVQARIVGKATFTFTDCNNGTMQYAFDAATNGAASGTITLTRLTPATESCVLADGTTRPGNAAPPANDFDTHQSGSWFETATSGQGLQFTVQPGGVFFAPWFTFDPAGPADDPGRQRWFTLQGGLAGARNGVVEVPIVQTIGGAFDSVPTSNMTIVGKATVTFAACDRAKVDYRFDDNDLAGAMRTLAGSIDLVKIGGCASR
ncbi:PQQ-binding-like beta-propeller repeat protein [Tahibacter soli]|uniref:PQQ-binding-like beta-propeller repeat protein n=1 Tax=Tahibacter soli TaxID=2983605 RepID=A0A9X4BFJ1_9GAMM|nr:PQQ-binding-like beta-propeller repeat protein [Tahibacter soli]MDC8011190.1 PQQ-binding-like beta-propeller repeat protein [Tahibacter soli]